MTLPCASFRASSGLSCFLSAVLCLIALPGTSATASPELIQFDNGLRLIVLEDPNLTLVEVQQFYGSGSAQDPPGKEGMAHLLEHFMVNEWTPDGSSVRKLDLRTTYQNASTGLTKTRYETWCLPQFLPEVLQIESERLTHFAPSAATVERERFVVRQEIALRDRVRGRSDLLNTILQASYAGHLFERPIGGTDSSVAAIDILQLQDFHKRTMCTQNLAMVISGPLKATEVVELVGASFAKVPASPDFQAFSYPAPPERAKQTCELDRRDEDNLTAMIGFRLPATTPREFYLGLMAYEILNGDRTGESFVPMPNEFFVALRSGWFYSDDPDDFNPDRLRQYAWSDLWEKIHSRIDTRTLPDSFEVVRQDLLDNTQTTRQFIHSFGPELIFHNESWATDRDSILHSITATEMRAYLDEHIVSENSSSGVVHGRKSKRPIPLELHSLQQGKNWGSEAPDPREDLSAEVIGPVLEQILRSPRKTIESARLQNGVPLFYATFATEQEIRLGGAKTFNPIKNAIKRPGIMALFNVLFEIDPKPRSRSWLRLPYNIQFTPRSQSLTFRARSKQDDLDKMGSAITLRMQTREFNVATWSLIRDYPSYFLTPRNYSADAAAGIARWSAILGAEDPLLGEWCGNARDVSKWKYDDLRSIQKDMMTTGNLRLYATGSIDLDTLQVELNGSFGRLKGYQHRTDRKHSTSVQDKPFVTIISAFDRRNSRITWTFQPLALEANAIDWATLELFKACIQIRAFSRLRDREGLSYTMNTYFVRAGDDLLPELEVSTFPAATKRTLAAVLEELRILDETGLDEGLFARARLSAANQLLITLNDPSKTFRELEEMSLLGDPPVDPVAAILSVDRDRVDSLLRQCIDTAHPVVSACGPILEEEAESLTTAVLQRRP